MAFVKAALAASLNSGYSTYGEIAPMADKYASSVIDFWNTGMTGFGNTASASSAKSGLYNDIKSALEAYSSSTIVVAQNIAKAIDKAAKMIITSGPANHISTTPTATAALYSGLISAYASYDSSTFTHANSEANAILTYSMGILIMGIIPGSPPVPVSGTLM